MVRITTYCAALLFTVASPIGAQVESADGARKLLHHWGLSAGLAGGELVTTSYKWTRAGSSGLGFDGAVTTAPEVLANGVLALALQAGPAVALPIQSSVLLLKAGAMPVVAGGGGGSGGWLTVYYGVGVVLGGRTGSGLRVDWARHHLVGTGGGGAGLLEVGFAKAVGSLNASRRQPG